MIEIIAFLQLAILITLLEAWNIVGFAALALVAIALVCLFLYVLICAFKWLAKVVKVNETKN